MLNFPSLLITQVKITGQYVIGELSLPESLTQFKLLEGFNKSPRKCFVYQHRGKKQN